MNRFARGFVHRCQSVRVGVAAAVLAATVGCGGGATSDAPAPATSRLKGTVAIEGSSTVFRISQAAQVEFAEVQPDVDVQVSGKGTGPGFERYFRGEIDIIDASRAAKPGEEEKANEPGFAWTRFLVGYDGITVVVNKKNDFVKSLTVAQLKELFRPDSPVATWKDLDPNWPERPIKLFTPDNSSGTFEFFADAIVGAKATRKDIQTSTDDNTLVTGVSGDVDGLGYFGYAYYEVNTARLRHVPIQVDAESPAVDPSPTTILEGTYRPLARPLYIYVKNAAIARPEVAAFVRFYLEEIDELTEEAGYVPPTPSDKAANQRALAGLAGESK